MFAASLLLSFLGYGVMGVPNPSRAHGPMFDDGSSQSQADGCMILRAYCGSSRRHVLLMIILEDTCWHVCVMYTWSLDDPLKMGSLPKIMRGSWTQFSRVMETPGRASSIPSGAKWILFTKSRIHPVCSVQTLLEPGGCLFRAGAHCTDLPPCHGQHQPGFGHSIEDP